MKSVLQPTRALGDFRLKYQEFNDPKDFGKNKGYPRKIEDFNGPYITHRP